MLYRGPCRFYDIRQRTLWIFDCWHSTEDLADYLTVTTFDRGPSQILWHSTEDFADFMLWHSTEDLVDFLTVDIPQRTLQIIWLLRHSTEVLRRFYDIRQRTLQGFWLLTTFDRSPCRFYDIRQRTLQIIWLTTFARGPCKFCEL
jgi:hypothetical protein